MQSTIQPTAVQKIGTELAIAWSDGVETFIPLERLRRACPCATCNGEPDVTGKGDKPTVTYREGSFELAGWKFVGGYGIQPHWNDGHNTGIYSHSLLRSLTSPA